MTTGLLNKCAAYVQPEGEAVPADWIARAGLDWEPRFARLRVEHDEAVPYWSRSRAVLGPTGEEIAVVGRAYRPTPQVETLERFEAALRGHGYKLRCAGQLDHGRAVFAEGVGPEARDGVESFAPSILLILRHDLARPSVSALQHRLSCTNMVFGKSATGDGVTHRFGSRSQGEILAYAAEQAAKGSHDWLVIARALRDVPMNFENARRFHHAVLNLEPGSTAAGNSKTLAALSAEWHGYANEVGQNAWAALNCVSHIIDHAKHGNGNRLMSAVSGKLAAIRARANELARAYLN